MPRYLTPRRLDVVLVVVLGIATLYFARTGWNGENPTQDAPLLPVIGPIPPWPPPAPPSFSDTLPAMLGNLTVVLLLIGRRRWPISVFALQFGFLLRPTSTAIRRL
jgi:hypothetical protein